MLTSTRRGISYPNTSRVDAPDIPLHFQNIVAALDIDVIWLSGLFASRPVSTGGSPGLAGRVYYSTDIPQLDLDFGTGWITLYPQVGTSVPIGGSLSWDYAAAGIPSWSLLQYGQAISRATYVALNALASAASYPHGNGDGSTTFNLADKRGRVDAGKDDMGGSTAGRITAAISGTAGTVLGATVGNEGVTLSTGQIPSHNHTITGAPSVGTLALPDHIHHVSIDDSSIVGTGGGPHWIDPQGTPDVTDPGTGVTIGNPTTHPAIDGAPAVGSLATGNTGSGGAHLNTQPTIIVNRIVRVL